MISVPSWSVGYNFIKMCVTEQDLSLRELYHEHLLPIYYSSSEPEKLTVHNFIFDVTNDPELRNIFYV